jgi:hypothetical protein
MYLIRFFVRMRGAFMAAPKIEVPVMNMPLHHRNSQIVSFLYSAAKNDVGAIVQGFYFWWKRI